MIDFSSPTWHSMRKWAEEQLRVCREKNDAPGLNENDTALVRGEIRLLKRILDLPNAASRITAEEPE